MKDSRVIHEIQQRGRRQVALLWASVALLLIAASPFGPWIASGMWACPFKSWTGIPCPSCGLTRSALTLAEFKPLEALIRYPLPTLVWMILIIGGLVAGALVAMKRELPGLPRRLPGWSKASIVSLLLLGWLYSWQTGV